MSTSVLNSSELLGMAGSEPGHHAVLLPNLNVMAVNNLLGGLNGCGVVRTIEIYGFYELAVLANDVGSIVWHSAARYCGARRPGEFSHSLMSLAVSNCLAFLRSSSRSGPGFSRDAFRSRRAFCSANRSWNVWGCERERSMDHSFPV
jgi:hypothetical protein